MTVARRKKKAAVKKAVKKAAAKKSAAKKNAVKKTTVKKAAVKKTTAKKAAGGKRIAKKTAVKKAAVKKKTAGRKPAVRNAIRLAAAADQPMQIVSTSYSKTQNVITVTWAAVDYSDLDGFVVGIIEVGYRMDNYPQSDPTATTAYINYTEDSSKSYQAFVEPIISGTPRDGLVSPAVSIPYPAT